MQRRRTETLGGPLIGDRFGVFIRKYYTGVVLIVLFGLSGSGMFEAGLPGYGWLGPWALGFLWVLASLGIRYISRAATDRRSKIESLSILILGTNAFIQMTGGLNSPLTLIYIFIVLLTSLLADVSLNGFALAAILLLEGMNLLAGPIPPVELQGRALIWAAGLSLIPLVVWAYLRAEHQEKDELKATVQRFRTSARVFQPLPGLGQPNQIWALTPDERDRNVAPLHERFDRTVDKLFWMLKAALPVSHHLMLFLPEEGGERFRIHKFAGGDPREIRSHFTLGVGEGVIGFSAKERRLYRIGRYNPDQEALGYCGHWVRVGSMVVSPLVRGEILEGILLVDSLQSEAFGEEDEQVVLNVSEQLLEAMENRRQHQAAQIRAQELSTLMAISEALGSKLELDHRLETMADKVKEIIPYDHCFILLVEPGERRAELKVARGYSDSRLPGANVPLHDGLLSIVVKRRVPLIRLDMNERERGRGIFPTGCGIHMKPSSFLGLPLISQDRVIGIFAMTSQRPKAFDEQHKEFLKTLCSQAAISIADAKLHEEVNRLATMDGLTAVANHRRFQERLNEEFERQAREAGTFSLLMIDVDHFKNINDQFGHPSGDQVLKQVSDVLVQAVRKIDIVARYGGEEFAIILLNTGAREAHALAERIRKSVEGLCPIVQGTPQKVTISLGIAVYPEDARDRQMLIRRADEALYAAKQGGRNRTCAYSRIKS